MAGAMWDEIWIIFLTVLGSVGAAIVIMSLTACIKAAKKRKIDAKIGQGSA